MLLEVLVQVRINPDKLRPYPTIANKPKDLQATRLVEEKLLGDIRWMDGFEKLERVQTKIIEPPAPNEIFVLGETGVVMSEE